MDNPNRLIYVPAFRNLKQVLATKEILERKFFPYVIKPGRYVGGEPGQKKSRPAHLGTSCGTDVNDVTGHSLGYLRTGRI